MSAPLVVLGATGSIGTQTLEVASNLFLDVAVIAARRPSDQLAAIAARYPDAEIVVAGGAGGMTGGMRRIRTTRQRGVASMLAMLFLILFSILALGFYSMVTT